MKPKLTWRERWMANFEQFVLELDAGQAGKIQWDNAVYFYMNGWTPRNAATRYVANQVR